jgi:hypothetical protein
VLSFPLMALRDTYCDALLCPVLGAKPTFREHRRNDVVDPERTVPQPLSVAEVREKLVDIVYAPGK